MTNLSDYKQSYTDSLAYALRNANLDFEFLKVYRKLIGLELAFGTTEYGAITHFKDITERRDTRTYAITNKGFEFECEQLLYLLRLIEIKSQGIEIVYPQGSDYAENWVKPKRSRKASIITAKSFIHPSQFDYYTYGKKGNK